MSISDHQYSITPLKDKNKVIDGILSTQTSDIDNSSNDTYAYAKHLKSPLTCNFSYIGTESAFTSEYDYSIYSLSDDDTIVTLNEENKNENEMMKYFDKEYSYVTIKQNPYSINSGENIINGGVNEYNTRVNKHFFDDSSYDIYSCDSDYQSQTLQTFWFY